MQRGCIASEDLRCHECHHIIPYAARYLAIDAEDSDEAARDKIAQYCVECALQKGYAHYTEEKGERILTFFA